MNELLLHDQDMYVAKLKTGDLNQAEVLFSQAAIAEASSSNSKMAAYDFLDDTPDLDLDMKMVADMRAAFVDSLGDASMDSFTDLTGILTEPALMGHSDFRSSGAREEDSSPLHFLCMDAAGITTANTTTSPQHSGSLKRPFADIDDSASDLAQLSASVGLARSRTPSLDHDYSTKRLRLSPASPTITPEPTPSPALGVNSREESPFLVPELSPVSSPSPSNISVDAKKRERREKNNLASKRSREIRKRKFIDMGAEVKRLTEENGRLEQRVAEMEKLAREMKEALVTRLKIAT